ncbi:MAG: nucleoside monophosphate kinase [bacterium]
MPRIVMMGPPGSGKGTQGVKLAERFDNPHVSSGDILRRILASNENSELANAVRIIEEGKMVTDEIAGAIVFRELENVTGFILDGYPRNVRQAELLDIYLKAQGNRLDAALYLAVDKEELMRRLTGRLTCENCGETYHLSLEPPRRAGFCNNCGSPLIVREDDQPDRITVRLRLYLERTRPVLDYYQASGLLRKVDGIGSQEQVFARCEAALL